MFSSLDWNQPPWSSVGWELAGSLEKVKMCVVSISWQVRNIRKVLREIDKPFGLYPNFLSPVSGNWMQREYRCPWSTGFLPGFPAHQAV